MINLDSNDIPYSTLLDFALGRLPADQALKVVTEAERNPKVSKDLEFVIKILNFFKDQRGEMDAPP